MNKQLPVWTWIAPFILLHIGSEVSALFKYAPGAALYYLPTSIGIVLINWWGPKRVVPSMFVNAVVSAHLWDVGPWYLWPVFATPETLFTWASWLMFTSRRAGKYWLPDFRAVIEFLILGIIIPLLLEISLLELAYFMAGERNPSDLLHTFVRSSLGEFISNFGLTVPVLYYGTYKMQSHGLLLVPIRHLQPIQLLKTKNILKVSIVFGVLLSMSIFIPFDQYWFLFGTFSLFMAIRFGFGVAILTNTYIFLLTYLLPIVTNLFFQHKLKLNENITNIYLGTSLLYVFSAITGRVLSDLVNVKRRLSERVNILNTTNRELENINREMDHFVYSVSHDLSAPLKSILGLVNISMLTDKLDEHRRYFHKIEVSVKKLNSFISQTLDYSRNKRDFLASEEINLHELCKSITDELKSVEGFGKVHVNIEMLKGKSVVTDPRRLKIILDNLLTNAFKYQKPNADSLPMVRVYTEEDSNFFCIHVEDNGEGVPDHLQRKIFNMFFRGHEKSQGSGLGLYIAQESATRLNAAISLKSVAGSGSVFTITFWN